MPSQYSYITNCIHATAEDVQAMVDTARAITYRTFTRHVPLSALRELFPYYAARISKNGGLTIKHDWAIGYYKSTYQGTPCVFIDHSHIDYIFIKQEEVPQETD